MPGKKGLFIGRFQPFHLGHLSAVKQALKQVDFLIIGIGSSQYNKTDKNPFTANEREQMIRGSLNQAGIEDSRFQVIQIPDIHNDAQWADHVRKLVGNFDVLFLTNDGIVKKLFEPDNSIETQMLTKEIDINATQIRAMMKKGGEWQKFVPKATAEVINPQPI